MRFAGAGSRACCAAIALVAAGVAPDPAAAQGRVEARYTATLSGIPVGRGTWVIDIGADQYTAAASGRAGGVLRLFANGEGTGAARGTVSRGRLVPGTFSSAYTTRNDSYDVRMALAGGAVKDVKTDPPYQPSPDRVPLTDAHRRGVLDPMTAVLMTAPGTGGVLTPETCSQRLPIFDGRQRFDLVLSFKRMENVQSAKGYSGPAVVCAALYEPIAGHRPERYAIKYLRETRDIEIWLVPIAGTRVVVPYRVSVPTLFGAATLQATQFETEAQAARPTSATSTIRARRM